MHYTKPPEVDRAWPSIEARAIFDPLSIFKWEGLWVRRHYRA